MSTDNYCCDEHTCRRKSPLNIVYGELSGRVFVVTRRRVVRDRGDGTATFAAVERHDITEQFQDFLANNAEAILDMLAEATAAER